MSPALEFHPYSNLFPLIRGEDFSLLKQDIEGQGQLEPIVLFEGQILDGRNRYRACQALGIEPKCINFEGEDALAFVLSLNMFRRQLSVAQRSVVAAELLALRSGSCSQPEEAQVEAQGSGIEQMAQLFGVSPRSVSSASRVLRDGAPELVQAVKTGKVSISAAEHVSKLEPVLQEEACTKGAKAISKLAKEVRLKQKQEIKVASNSVAPELETIESSQSQFETDEYHVFSDIPESTTTPDTREICSPEISPSAKKTSALRLVELTDQALDTGQNPEHVAQEILLGLEKGRDTQQVLFAIQVAIHLQSSLAVQP